MNMHIPVPDRQRPTATLAVTRGARRLFSAMGHATLQEVCLANGRRADIVALCPAGGISIIEVKSCLADLRADGKWREYRGFCDRIYFAVDQDFPLGALPEDVGVILADAHGAEISTAAPLHALAGARRKAVTLRFAHKAAEVLHRLDDPTYAPGG